MSTEPSDAKSPEAQQNELLNVRVENHTSPDTETPQSSEASPEGQRRRILIGSQRDPAAYLAQPRKSKAPVVSPEAKPKRPRNEASSKSPAAAAHTEQVARPQRQQVKEAPAAAMQTPRADAAAPPMAPPTQPTTPSNPQPYPAAPAPLAAAPAPLAAAPSTPAAMQEPAPAQKTAAPEPRPAKAAKPAEEASKPAPSTERMPAPNIREKLSPDLEAELAAALGESSVDDLLAGSDAAATQSGLEPDSKHTGRVVAVRREDVFVELGSREQGVASLRQFHSPPEPGDMVEVIVRSLNREDGFYELTIPGQAEEVADWADLQEGMVVSARVTGHNTGGLECEVNHIRGFIPVSQVSLYRVENLEQFLGEQWPCLVTEANPDRRNLVLSRRAILEREREESRQQLFDSLAPGQVFDGVVRKILDFGAFVDLGDGVDGLLHISQLSWSRVNHPSDVLTEGQHIRVRIDKIDPETRKISLSYRDLFESPWTHVTSKYPEHSTVSGKVTKLMEFGAFVELEPGVEGLVHISELSHKRVWRASDVVQEGQEVEVLVLSVDTEAQRIGLSMKQLTQPEPVKKDDEQSEAAEPEPVKSRMAVPNRPLKGGLGRSSGGAAFGLKW